MEIMVNNRLVRLDARRLVGQGGEAEIYRSGTGRVWKIFKTPGHPDFVGQPQEQAAVKARLDEHQQKLRDFPKNLPANVVVPEELVYDKTGRRIIGYGMRFLDNTEPFLKLTDKAFRQAGWDNDKVIRKFCELHALTLGLHQKRVVVGDYNDLNALFDKAATYLIDADSYQFGRYLCRMFTAKYVDPLLCDAQGNLPILAKPHNADSDWYAYAVMLFGALLLVDPYGGIYRPSHKSRMVSPAARLLRRITVFDPEVRYPKPAVPYSILPDDLLHYYHELLEKDRRGEFPLGLIKDLKWQKCPHCHIEYARAQCPNCYQAPPAAIKEIVHGNLTVVNVYRGPGLILASAWQENRLRWLAHDQESFRREDGRIVLEGPIDHQTRFGVWRQTTLFGRQGQLRLLAPNQPERILDVDSYGNLPVFAANERHLYWVSGGRLLRDGRFGLDYPEEIGQVLPGQTVFWVGPESGFGFYRAGQLSSFFLFDAKAKGLNDSVKLPPIKGRLLDAAVCFGHGFIWVFFTIKEKGAVENVCYLIDQTGHLLGQSRAVPDDGSWLGKIRGRMAAGNFLFAATDDGIVRVENQSGQLAVTREFPDTAAYVDSASRLYPGQGVINVVKSRQIISLAMK